MLAPALALAQGVGSDSRPNAEPVSGDVGFGPFLWVILIVAAIAILLYAVRTMRRQGPHGPQAPTPRGP